MRRALFALQNWKTANIFRTAEPSQLQSRPSLSNRAPDYVERFWELRTETSDIFRRKLAQLTPIRLQSESCTCERGAGYFENGAMSFPAQCSS